MTDAPTAILPIEIRPIQVEDALQAANIWAMGLEQTIETAPREKQEELRSYFHESRDKECSVGGRVGIEGKALFENYGNGGPEIAMFVAVRNETEVLGLVGVKRGMDYETFPTDTDSEDYGFFSIWKLSVSPSGRRLGLGRKLMMAAEDFARGRNGSKAMRLYTGNPVAANFYISPKIGFIEMELNERYGVYQKELK